MFQIFKLLLIIYWKFQAKLQTYTLKCLNRLYVGNFLHKFCITIVQLHTHIIISYVCFVKMTLQHFVFSFSLYHASFPDLDLFLLWLHYYHLLPCWNYMYVLPFLHDHLLVCHHYHLEILWFNLLFHYHIIMHNVLCPHFVAIIMISPIRSWLWFSFIDSYLLYHIKWLKQLISYFK